MNRRLLLIIVVAIAVFIPTATAYGFYATVSGELRDNATNALWTHGASVLVYNCNTLATINTANLTAPTSKFSIPISVVVDTPVCILVTFNDGGNGVPGKAAKGPYPNFSGDSGDLNTGVYFTGTGPTAVTLSNLSATPNATTGGLWVVAVLALSLLVGGGLIARRRSARS